MLKLLLASAPYLIRSSPKTSRRFIARRLLGLGLLALGGLTFLIALFLWMAPRYGADIAWLTVSGIFFVIGLICFMGGNSVKSKPNGKASATSKSTLSLTETELTAGKTDPIAALLPDGLKQDPNVKAVIARVSENPVAASVAAVAIGMIISREIFGKD